MQATNFQYDGMYLSDFGFIICDFSSNSGPNSVSGGSVITFDKVSRDYGRRFSLSSSKYEECIESTFDICKDPDKTMEKDMAVSDTEFRALVRWLNRRDFNDLYFMDDCGSGDANDICHYNASFNVEKLVVDGATYGLRLKMETDSPFGHGSERVHQYTSVRANTSVEIECASDEIGFIYPKIVVTCGAAGTLTLRNETNGSTCVVKGCASGETITFDGDTQQIYSSRAAHNVANDFSYSFISLQSGAQGSVNVLSSSLQCGITVSYKPIIKLTP